MSMTENEAFTRLEELVAQLPTMEQQGAHLAQARAAREALVLGAQADVLEQEFNNYNTVYTTAIDDAAIAESAGDTTTQARELGAARAYAELIAVRRAPLERAQRAYQQALDLGAFKDVKAARIAALSDESFAALEREVEDFRREYTEVYEICEKFEHNAAC